MNRNVCQVREHRPSSAPSYAACILFFRLDVGLALMGVEKIVIEDIRHLLETAVEVLHLQVLGRIFAGMTDGIEEKADHHADRDDDGGDFGQEQAVLQQVVQHVKAPVEISSAYQGAWSKDKRHLWTFKHCICPIARGRPRL